MVDYVYVVTDVELGWDCVCGVYLTEEEAEDSCKPDQEEYEADKEWWDKRLNSQGMYDTRIIHTKKLGGW